VIGKWFDLFRRALVLRLHRTLDPWFHGQLHVKHTNCASHLWLAALA
jgi:hypothetical protein